MIISGHGIADRFGGSDSVRIPYRGLAAITVSRARKLGPGIFSARTGGIVLESTPPLTLSVKQVNDEAAIPDQAIQYSLDFNVVTNAVSQFKGW